jgi:hypothetical protein
MVILGGDDCAVFFCTAPVFTAYEFLEKRFPMQNAIAHRILCFSTPATLVRLFIIAAPARVSVLLIFGWPLQ